jgi:hypothetical protein
MNFNLPNEWFWQEKFLTWERAIPNTNNMENQKNSGAMFKNRKETPQQPDYSGTALIDGKKYRLAGWVNKSKSGANYLRILISETLEPNLNAEGSQSTMPMQPMASQGQDNTNDDLPF